MRAIILVLCGWLPLCGGVSADASGIILWYLHQEPGTEPYRVRYIVTRDYLRSDEGGNHEGFVLLDRRMKQIYNVVPENRSILQIDGNGVVPGAPEDLAIEVRESRDPNAPTLGGKSALMLELLAGSEVCHTALVVPGMLDEVWQAFGEFQRALAVQQQRTLAHTPKEMQTPCFLANYLYATDYHLGKGVPLIEWRGAQDSRELLSYEADVRLDETLFELPEAFAISPAPGR